MARMHDNATELSPARRRALRELSERLGHEFADPTTLAHALVHSSMGNQGKASYERLEFLGDAILGFIVADHLFRTTRLDEGELTDLRSKIVCREALARVAQELELIDYLEVGRGLQCHEITPRIQADLVEAILGAVYVDGGIRAARRFVRRHVLPAYTADPRAKKPARDPKSRLLHYAQAHELGQPRYLLVAAEGPPHQRTFTAAVVLGEEEIARGEASTKQGAEMLAAERGLELLRAAAEAAAPE